LILLARFNQSFHIIVVTEVRANQTHANYRNRVLKELNSLQQVLNRNLRVFITGVNKYQVAGVEVVLLNPGLRSDNVRVEFRPKHEDSSSVLVWLVKCRHQDV
jgi:hypothetical protein